jgi:hypothetical protein
VTAGRVAARSELTEVGRSVVVARHAGHVAVAGWPGNGWP